MSKKTPPAAKPKANIDFEKEFWDAAYELSGTAAENQYKDYVLIRGAKRKNHNQ
ncbi:type I restriction-modification system DNA methylase [Flammeovirgaceae bacterium 311]|nr:type I restriction-modification system DNA methylase [Flammeovirgaceae bacterium 311]